MPLAVPETLSGSRLRRRARGGVRIALGLLFVWAGAAKLLAPRAFAATISRFDLVPEAALPVLAIGLPVIELAAGLGAVAGRRAALHAILAMLVLFTLALGSAYLAGFDVDCGCFGPADAASADAVRRALLRDVVLISVTVWLLRADRRERAAFLNRRTILEPEETP